MLKKISVGMFLLAALSSPDAAHAFGKPKPKPTPTPSPTSTATPTPTPTPTATPTPTPTPTSAPVFSSDAQIREAVSRAYLAILQRNVDPSGATAYFNQVKSDGLTGWKNGLHGLADSAEFRDNVRPNKSDEQILDSLYQYFLLRGVDPSGSAAYLPMINAGKTGDVAEAVGASPEFFEAIKRPIPTPTPTPTPTPSPTPTSGPSNCGPPVNFEPIEILRCHRAKFGTPMTGSEELAIVRGSARDFNAAGVPQGPFGILKKAHGNNCGGYSCDILCAGQGSDQKQWDVLVDSDRPHWGPPIAGAIRVDVCEIQSSTPAPSPTPTATPTPTPTPTSTSTPVWPKTGREVVEFVRARHPDKLVVTSTLQERKDNMAFIRDRMIEAGICGGLDLGLNLKRGGPEISIDYLAHQSPVGLRGVDIGMAYDDHNIPLQLYWGEQEDPYAKYKYYEPRPSCK